ncbi:MAG: histidinol-phosphate transaminase [Clostridia bacterium]|nr:histidinol-phosphate transaminase [Clostridia bacterium]
MRSRFFSERFAALEPYVPGEQPRDRSYLKLNTNENPYPPTESALEKGREALERLNLYSDPTCRALNEEMARVLGTEPDRILMTNGSDEVLFFAFLAFCDESHPAFFPDITYGFYPVFARLTGVPFEEIPLADDFRIHLSDYEGKKGTLFLANPNAPTGIALSRAEIEAFLARNPDLLVVADEAYVDFGAESCVLLIDRYDNLLVTQTFSKSRSLAGGRLGCGIGGRPLIDSLNAVKYSVNPYNVNAVTQAAGIGMLRDEAVTRARCAEIAKTRDRTAEQLRALGFTVTDSRSNFLFAAHPSLDGAELAQALRDRGILIRHFSVPRIRQYNRISVGTPEQMGILVNTIQSILEGRI